MRRGATLSTNAGGRQQTGLARCSFIAKGRSLSAAFLRAMLGRFKHPVELAADLRAVPGHR
jgi:hypothetical protein